MNTQQGLFCFPNSWFKTFALLLLAFAFVTAGINHFLNPQLYVLIMPPYLPAHLELVYISGVFEVLLVSYFVDLEHSQAWA